MMHSWFLDAKLGIFIHYGIYAVKGIPESWAFFNREVTYVDYMSQLDGFTAAAYDPEDWADLFVKAGARYAVLTSKHHDGVALFDTEANDLSVVKKTPAGRDLIEPYCSALRKYGLKVGLYFSHLDWSHPDYASVRRPDMPDTERGNPFAYADVGKEDLDAWERFLQFHRQQLKEICTRYGTIDLLWFDGDWERTADQFKMAELREELHAMQPGVILNSRMLGYGDYATPEQGLPLRAPDGPWEFCVTINDSWGYQVNDHNQKSVRQLVRMFAETIGMGGNMLLDVGPTEDGRITTEQRERLLSLGDWISKHDEAIYGTVAGMPPGHFYGCSTLSKDRTKLYLFLFDRPIDQIAIRGLCNEVVSATVLGKSIPLTHTRIGGASWHNVPGIVWIDVPEDAVDDRATVIRLELDGELRLYSGVGRD